MAKNCSMALQLHKVFPDSYQDQTFYASKLTEQLTMLLLRMPFLKTFIKLSCTTCILNNFYTYEDFKIGICTLKYMQIEAGL